jgi:hypothetical protein
MSALDKNNSTNQVSDSPDKLPEDSSSSKPGLTSANPDSKKEVSKGNSANNVSAAKDAATDKKSGSFPSDLSNMRQIFQMKSKTSAAKERCAQKAQDYLESHKMSIYLQDAIKIILDRKDEKPIDILTE